MRPEDLKQSYEVPARAAAEIQRRYPNATLAGGAGAFGTCVVWTSTNVARLPMDAAVGAAFATVFSSAALVIGRRGLKGVLRAMWRGNSAEE